ncbi:MAG: hypothetical protein EOO04_18105 [Chitinophagaceae bacterium]|nr:MAG: hypothetical protein EOO04_18105 [Chitinophagaceae bacterium]
MRHTFVIPALLLTLVLGSCEKDKDRDTRPQVFTSNGNIITRLDEFRQSLGQLNTQLGATTGRREISWEAVPDDMLDKTLPPQFFNQVGTEANPSLQKGIAYEPSFDFRVSKTQFASLDPEAASQFKAFSGIAVFARVGDQPQPWPISFQVAGVAEAAAVRGFGMVVSDVDVAGSVKIDYFNGSTLIGSVDVPARTGDSPFSFAGLLFKDPVITSIRVTHQGLLKAGEKDITQGGTHDLVVMDDFIYAEPVRQ